MDETSVEVTVGDVLRIGDLRMTVRAIQGDEVVLEIADSDAAGHEIALGEPPPNERAAWRGRVPR